MDHISANLAFGGREKIFGGTKSSRGGGQEAYKKNRKKSGDLFFFLETVKFFVGSGKKNQQGGIKW